MDRVEQLGLAFHRKDRSGTTNVTSTPCLASRGSRYLEDLGKQQEHRLQPKV